MRGAGRRGRLGKEPANGFLPQTPSSRRIAGGSGARFVGIDMGLRSCLPQICVQRFVPSFIRWKLKPVAVPSGQAFYSLAANLTCLSTLMALHKMFKVFPEAIQNSASIH